MATTFTIDSEVSFAAITYLFGNLISLVFGSAIIVACAFYLTSTTDRKVFKCVVTAGLLLEIIHVGLALADTLRTFGDGFGNVDRVYALSPFYCTGMIIAGTTACLVQSFYAWRCYHLLGKRIALLLVLGVFILFCFASFFSANVIAYTSSDPALFMTNGATLEAFIYLRLPYIAAIAIDAMLCGLTLFALHRAQEMGSTQGVGRIVQRLVVLTITSNGLTTSYCIFLLVVSIHYTGAFWALTLAAPDIYMLTLLVWLYQRQSASEFRRGSASGGSSGASGDSEQPLRPRAASSFGSPVGTPKKPTMVHVTSITTILNSGPNDDESDYDIFLSNGNEKNLNEKESA